MQYAARAMQLAKEVAGVDLRKYFLGHLQEAVSNLPALGTGEQIWNKFVEPTVTDLFKVSAHYAVSLLFDHQGVKTLGGQRERTAGTVGRRLASGLRRPRAENPRVGAPLAPMRSELGLGLGTQLV